MASLPLLEPSRVLFFLKRRSVVVPTVCLGRSVYEKPVTDMV